MVVNNPMFCGDIVPDDIPNPIFGNRYGVEQEWTTYTECRAYCALGFE